MCQPRHTPLTPLRNFFLHLHTALGTWFNTITDTMWYTTWNTFRMWYSMAATRKATRITSQDSVTTRNPCYSERVTVQTIICAGRRLTLCLVWCRRKLRGGSIRLGGRRNAPIHMSFYYQSLSNNYFYSYMFRLPIVAIIRESVFTDVHST